MVRKRLARRGVHTEIIPNCLYDDQRVADFLQVSIRTLQKWRTEKTGPTFLKLNDKLIRYEGQAVLDFIKASKRHG